MKKIALILYLFLMAFSMTSQNLNNLTAEQLELYKKYKTQITESTAKNNTDDNQNTDRMLSEKELYESTLDENNLESKTLSKLPITKTEKEKKDSLDLEEIVFDEENGKFIRIKKEPELKVFGFNFFEKQNLTFEPKLDIPTPPDYVMGTYDELVVDVSGQYEANYRVKVSPDGFVRIPTIGLIKVSGQTISEVTSILKNRFSQVYNGVSSGQTRINVGLGNIRSIRISVVGEAVRPGSYTLPSLSTAFNALYSCGGPGKMGSMRDIKVIRKGKVIASIDMYNFLVDGINKNNIALQDEDVLKIEPYKNRVIIKGEIKHPAIFEVLKNETLKDLIRYASGFSENANTSLITLLRNDQKNKKVVDIKESDVENFSMESGDEYTVTKNYDKYDNRVTLVGEIYRPGVYSLESGLSIKQLIEKADGLKDEAYLSMAKIIRQRDNQIPEIIGFNLGKIMLNDAQDILLQKDDSIKIGNLYDYQEIDSVTVWGAVKEPGMYKLNGKTTLKDIIFLAKGFTEMAANESIEVIRIIKDLKTLRETDSKTKVLTFSLNKNLDLKDDEGSFELQNGDQIIVRTIPGYEQIRMVRVEGEVLQPGKYNILNKRERISDVVKRSGGFTSFAYPKGAYLVRQEKSNEMTMLLKQKIVDNLKRQIQSESSSKIDINTLKESGQNIEDLKKEISGSKSVDQIFETQGLVGIDLGKIMQNPGQKQDFFLEDGDYIYIPRELQTIRVLGEVLFPTYVGFDASLSLKDYVDGAGGFSDNALRKSTFIVHANGTVKGTRSFLGFKFYPRVSPGSHIVVPPKPTSISKKLSTAETVSIMTSIATVATLMISVFK